MEREPEPDAAGIAAAAARIGLALDAAERAAALAGARRLHRAAGLVHAWLDAATDEPG